MLITSGSKELLSKRVNTFIGPSEEGLRLLPVLSFDRQGERQMNTRGDLVSDQDNNFYLITLSILITCFLNNVWIF